MNSVHIWSFEVSSAVTAVRPLAEVWARLPEERRQTVLGALAALLSLVLIAAWFALQVRGSLPEVPAPDPVGPLPVQGTGPGALDAIAADVRLATQPAVAE